MSLVDIMRLHYFKHSEMVKNNKEKLFGVITEELKE